MKPVGPAISANKKTNVICGLPKLIDAHYAGTKQSNDCTLIITERDSGKAFAVVGLGVIGREKYGLYPLRGKILNIRGGASRKYMLKKKDQ